MNAALNLGSARKKKLLCKEASKDSVLRKSLVASSKPEYSDVKETKNIIIN